MVKYCAVIGKPVWTAFVSYRRLTEACTVSVPRGRHCAVSFVKVVLLHPVLPHVSTAGFRYQDTTELQQEVRQAMAGVMEAITRARTEILFMYKVGVTVLDSTTVMLL